MANKYYSMNEVPIGTEVIIKSSGKKGILMDIQHFPTSFKIKDEDDVINNYFTYEVELLGWPPKE